MADDTSSTRGIDDVPQNQNDGLSARFSRLASRTAALAGNYRTFAVMLGIVLVWATSYAVFCLKKKKNRSSHARTAPRLSLCASAAA
jgi:hypothetical protein